MVLLPWFTSLLLIAAEPGSPTPAPWAIDLIQRIGTLDAPDRQAWLIRLEQRRDYANRILLKADDADRERRRTAELLRQPMIAPEQLAELLQQTDAREKRAIERLAEQYRTENEKIFSRETAKLKEQFDAWREIYRAWDKAGRNFEEQDRLLAWLHAALRQTSDSTAALPAAPPFSPREKLQDSTVLAKSILKVQGSSAGTPQSAFHIPHSPSGPHPSPLPKGEGAVVTKDEIPELPRKSNEEIPEEPQQSTAAPVAQNDAATEALYQSSRAPETQDVLAIVKSAAAVSRRLVGVSEISQDVVKRPVFPESILSAAPAVMPALANAPPAIPAAENSITLSHGPRPLARLPGGEGMLASRVLRPPPPVESPLPQPTTAIPTSTASAIEVNREELVARIKGCNLTLRAIAAEFGTADDRGIGELEKGITQLESVVRQGRDLQLIRDLLSAEELRGVDAVDSPRTAIALLGRRIYDLRAGLAGSADTEEERNRLDELSRRLAELAVEK